MGANLCCFTSALPSVNEYLETTENVNVLIDNGNIIFEPILVKNIKTIGVIIYPGGRAEPKGYSQVAFNLAKEGYFTVICHMTCHLAIFSPNKASYIANKYSSKVEKWVIGGHSLGGVASVKFLRDLNKSKRNKYASNFAGLFLWGSRGYSIYDISNLSIPTLVLYTDLDGLVKKEPAEQGKRYLPKDLTEMKLYNGGNHTYFGHFPLLTFCCRSDNPATVSRDDQIRFIITEMFQFLCKL